MTFCRSMWMFIKKNVRTMKMHCALLVDDWMLKMKTHKIFSFIFSIYTKRMWQKQMTLWLWLACRYPQLRHCRAMDKFHSVNRRQSDYHIHWKWIQLMMNCWWCQLLKEKKFFVLIENWIFHSLVDDLHVHSMTYMNIREAIKSWNNT